MEGWLDFPIKDPKWRIRVLRILFPSRWWVRVGADVYVLREPPPEGGK